METRLPVVTHSQSSVPLVAIATPVYNGERYLAETMACVQALAYPRLVHVVLDNASTDATPDIIARHSNGRVPVLVSRNPSTIPVAANFNASLGLVPKEASYFRLLCADDLMAPDAISRKVDLAERHPDVDIVGCLEHSDHLREEDLPRDQEVFDGRAIAGAYLRGETSVLSGTHFLVRRRQLDDRVSFYDDRFESFCDADANLRVCLSGKFGFIHEGLATWRRHDNNAWNRHAALGISMVEWLELLKRYGDAVMEQEVYRERLTAYRRHCLRRLLLLRWRAGDKATFDQHMARLRGDGEPVGWLDFADALADWARLAVTGRRHLVGVARG
jgi:glycosyltransferase involved in cell wall biosynthesis